MIRIVIADDQPFVRQGLKYIIDSQADMQCVGEAEDGDMATRISLECVPDIVLMDIQMPAVTGIEATRSILAVHPDLKVILLTTFDVQDYVFDGIRAGAVGYVLKDTDMKELLEGIRDVHQGQALYKTSSASKAIAEVLSNHGVLPNGKKTWSSDLHVSVQTPEFLTEREQTVLQQMAYGRRNSEIASILNISSGTVKSHIHRILQKLGVEDRTQAVVLAIRTGLVD